MLDSSWGSRGSPWSPWQDVEARLWPESSESWSTATNPSPLCLCLWQIPANILLKQIFLPLFVIIFLLSLRAYFTLRRFGTQFSSTHPTLRTTHTRIKFIELKVPPVRETTIQSKKTLKYFNSVYKSLSPGGSLRVSRTRVSGWKTRLYLSLSFLFTWMNFAHLVVYYRDESTDVCWKQTVDADGTSCSDRLSARPTRIAEELACAWWTALGEEAAAAAMARAQWWGEAKAIVRMTRTVLLCWCCWCCWFAFATATDDNCARRALGNSWVCALIGREVVENRSLLGDALFHHSLSCLILVLLFSLALARVLIYGEREEQKSTLFNDLTINRDLCSKMKQARSCWFAFEKLSRSKKGQASFYA